MSRQRYMPIDRAIRAAWAMYDEPCMGCRSGLGCICDGCGGWCPHDAVADEHLVACFCDPFCFCAPRTDKEREEAIFSTIRDLLTRGVAA